MTRVLLSPSLVPRRLAALCFWLGAATTFLSAQPAPGPHEAGGDTSQPETVSRLARSTTDFWNYASENARRDLAFDIECDILYYNPYWNIMWIRSGEANEYANPGKGPRPFRSGDRVRFRGVFPAPATALDFSQADVEVLGRSQARPVPFPEGDSDLNLLRNNLVSVEAWVDRQDLVDGNFLRLFLSSHGRTFLANVTLSGSGSDRVLVDRRVRAIGVFAPRADPSGAISELQLMVPGMDAIEPIGLVVDDPRFQAPLRTIDELSALAAGTLVRLAGEVVDHHVGQSLTLRDASNQINLPATQVRHLSRGERVELVGVVEHQEGQTSLGGVSYRPVPADSGDAAHSSPQRRLLNLAARVRELSESELDQGRTAVLQGVVTWSDGNSNRFFLQDPSGGIEVHRAPDTLALEPGSLVEMTGEVVAGEFAPVVQARQITHLGALSYPTAPAVSLERALTGAEDAQWVSMRGYVYHVSRENGINTLHLSSSQGDFEAVFPSARSRRDLLHSVVEIQGVCQVRANQRRQLAGIRIQIPEEILVRSIDSAPVDPFALEELPLARLGRFNPGADALNFVNVAGTVLFHRPGHWLYLAEGDHVIRIHTREAAVQPRGRRLEVAGRLGRDRDSIVVREAQLQTLGEGRLPPVQELGPEQSDLTPLEGRLVAFTGTLINILETENLLRYTVQEGSLVVEAELQRDLADAPDRSFVRPALDSRLRITGVLVPAAGATRASTAGLILQLSDPADVAMLSGPPWWTSRRLTNVAVMLFVALGLGILWVRILRRRVQHQTTLIKEQLAREARLNEQLQHANRLESLGLLAGGIAHDFNNLLTVVLGNLSLLRLDTPADTDAERSLTDAENAIARARQLTLQLLTFAKGGTPVRTAEDLPGIINEVTHFALHGTSVQCNLAVATDVWPAHVDKGQISQVIQNLVINAVQAMPRGGRLDITLANVVDPATLPPTLSPGRFLRLDVRDTGCGIAEDDLGRIFDPYFSTKQEGHGLGLATVYSIIRKHHGEINVTSRLGLGTTFSIWLPAADRPLTSSPPFVVEDVIPPGRGERILVMDDEPGIRALAGKMLQQLGYDADTVAHGEDAVAAYEHARNEGRAYDAVILDLTIRGGMGGADTLKQLRLLDPDLKAIVSSGYSSDKAVAAHKDLGFDDLIPKPYELAKFATVLADVLGTSSANSTVKA